MVGLDRGSTKFNMMMMWLMVVVVVFTAAIEFAYELWRGPLEMR